MEKKQTAVDWFIENDSQLTIDFIQGKITQLEFAAKKAVLKFQALQMEKEQIIKSNRAGVDMVIAEERYITGEDYYNETYGDSNE